MRIFEWRENTGAQSFLQVVHFAEKGLNSPPRCRPTCQDSYLLPLAKAHLQWITNNGTIKPVIPWAFVIPIPDCLVFLTPWIHCPIETIELDGRVEQTSPPPPPLKTILITNTNQAECLTKNCLGEDTPFLSRFSWYFKKKQDHQIPWERICVAVNFPI